MNKILINIQYTKLDVVSKELKKDYRVILKIMGSIIIEKDINEELAENFEDFSDIGMNFYRIKFDQYKEKFEVLTASDLCM